MKNTKHLSQVLTQAALTRVQFDPTNRDHRIAYQVYRDTGKWTMNFFCECGYVSVVATIEQKIIEQSLKDIAHLAQPISARVLAEREERKARDAEQRASREETGGASTRDASSDAAAVG